MKCKCGCNTEFSPSKSTLDRIKKGKNSGYIPGHASRRSLNSNWKGGKFIAKNGYIYILQPNHPNALKKGYVGYIAEHRLVMSEHIKRPLKSNEIVHHINGNKSDNKLKNLKLMLRKEHNSMHCIGKNNGNWKGGRKPIICKTCKKEFLPQDRKNDYKAKYCSRKCFFNRNHK